MLKTILVLVFITISLYSDDINKVDCLILEDENSIICKYIVNRTNYEKPIVVQWIDPTGEISRSREMLVPAGHASIYDYRYIKGRILGTWTFKVIDDEKNEYSTNFDLRLKE